MSKEIFEKIDAIIKKVNRYKIEPGFSEWKEKRKNKIVPDTLSNNEIIEIFTTLIAYSQNANSKSVSAIIERKILNKVFEEFNIDKMVKLNPCDLADEYWDKIGGIRQQAKLFHIITLARKIKKIGYFNELLTNTGIPKKIKTEKDIEKFWKGFQTLKKVMNDNKIPFFRSTTSLLHLLLELGYDCVKPDLVVMKVAKKIGIVKSESGEANLKQAVRTIQEYAIAKNIRPPVIDIYFLIDEGQLGAKKHVEKEFYNS